MLKAAASGAAKRAAAGGRQKADGGRRALALRSEVAGRTPAEGDDNDDNPYNGDEEATRDPVVSRFMAVDGGSRPLAIESMPNTRPYFPRRRSGGVPANEAEAGNLAAVLRRWGGASHLSNPCLFLRNKDRMVTRLQSAWSSLRPSGPIVDIVYHHA